MRTTICTLALAACAASTLHAQAPAGAPRIFAPGVISSEFNETTAAFAPDGRSVYFTRADAAATDNTIMVSRMTNGRWAEPEVAPFSGEWRDSEPHVSPDGKRIFFVSNRPATPGGPPLMATLRTATFPGANLWYVERGANGSWGAPRRIEGPVNEIPRIYNPSVTRDGTLYFSGILADDTTKNQIYRSTLRDGAYSRPERLPFSDLRYNHIDPTVDPRERFVVFASSRPGTVGSTDLYIVFRAADGSWGEPVHLGAGVNSPLLENSPTLAPDGTTLYFASMRSQSGKFPKRRETARDVMTRLRSPENGSRNLWSVDLTPWLRAGGL